MAARQDKSEMVKRLTPYLLRGILALPLEERLELKRAIDTSITGSNPGKALGDLSRVMRDVSGIDVRERTRKAENVTARAVFVCACRQEGYTQREIGEYIGLNHSTVCHMEQQMTTAFTLPQSYPDYIALYNKYQSAIQ